ncbi:MAG TPA: hypothetical protein VMZ27_08260, partial [Candidatus Saccharimonadales bacterium]|nr:hypothetical protein [Candidatus Saccharimonadales bacterium]
SKIARHGVKALLNATGGPPKFAETAWAPRKVEDVAINAPFEFGPGPDISSQLPEQVRNAITHMQIFQSTGTPKSFVTMISRIEYKPGIKTSIDGAVQGAMRNMGAAIGDPDPKYSAAPTFISGLEGRKVSYHGQKSGQSVHVESVFANQGQKLWQIQVLYQHAESAPDVARIIQSVKIGPVP